ncbi:hypothetical protein SprV_0100195000 [Sparganum proliferum]
MENSVRARATIYQANQTAAAKANRAARRPQAAQTVSTPNSFQHVHDASENVMQGSTSPDISGPNATTTRQLHFPSPKTSHRHSRANLTTAIIITAIATYDHAPDAPTPQLVSSTPSSFITPPTTAAMTETTATIPSAPTTDATGTATPTVTTPPPAMWMRSQTVRIEIAPSSHSTAWSVAYKSISPRPAHRCQDSPMCSPESPPLLIPPTHIYSPHEPIQPHAHPRHRNSPQYRYAKHNLYIR